MQHAPSSRDQGRGRAVRDGMAARSEAGFLVRKARLGYVGVRTEDGTVERPDPRLAPLVRGAFEMAAGGQGLRAITAWLREQGVNGTRGKPVSLPTVYRVLSDPYYAGLIEDSAGRVRQGMNTELVTVALFRRVQRALASRRCGPLVAIKRPAPRRGGMPSG